MPVRDYRYFMQKLLAGGGIEVGGSAPWDIQVHHHDFYKRVITRGTLGLGESYLDGWWSCEALDQFFFKAITAALHEKAPLPWLNKAAAVSSRLFNWQTKSRSGRVATEHYDAYSRIVLSFLDRYKQYSCGYFQETDDLDRAQERKLEMVCRKLALRAGDRLLDVGCGYGGLARYAAERYGCKVTGISNSREQLEFARAFCQGLDVDFVETDYRDLRGSFTKAVSVGMFEHVGYKNYRAFMEVVHGCLEKNGLFLLQTIGGRTSVTRGDPWLLKYFFPNSMLPSLKQIAGASEGLFVLEDLHNFGSHYDLTLLAWHRNFVAAWPRSGGGLDERSFRMWEYYFLYFAGAFRSRMNQLWQVLFSKNGAAVTPIR